MSADDPSALLRVVLDEHAEGHIGYGSYARAFIAWARAAGLQFQDRRGVLVALNGSGRVVAAAETKEYGGRRRTRRVRPDAHRPCATCGQAPIGTFDDGSPRYPAACSHEPIWPSSEVPMTSH